MTPNQYLWAQARDRLVAAVTDIGFSAELAELIARQLGSPKAIDRMTSYVYQAHPRTEEMLVDEMLDTRKRSKPGGKRRKARKRRPAITQGCITRNGNQTRRNEAMKKFIPKEKLGKKARKQLDSEQRTTWAFSPVTKKVESKKLYNRKRKAHDRYDDYGMGFSCGVA